MSTCCEGKKKLHRYSFEVVIESDEFEEKGIDCLDVVEYLQNVIEGDFSSPENCLAGSLEAEFNAGRPKVEIRGGKMGIAISIIHLQEEKKEK